MAGVGGVLGAVGLAALFSTCVDCFGYFKASQNRERDYDILMVKLDVEKFRLLHWGSTVGLLDSTAITPSNPVLNDVAAGM